MTAAKTSVPVLGVPIQSKALNGIDSLLSIAQMPSGIPGGDLCHRRRRREERRAVSRPRCSPMNLPRSCALDAFRQAQTAAVLAKPDPRRS
jgi:5-(carboxyamino)imidazole ribonucleotide mutase